MASGYKTGGRRRGSLNKRTLGFRAAAAAVPPGESPLEFLMNVYRIPALPLEARFRWRRSVGTICRRDGLRADRVGFGDCGCA